MSTFIDTKPVTVPWVRGQKGVAPLSMLTAYDFAMSRLLDESGVDLLLVGDSVGTVMYGEPNTLAVTMEDMLRHTRAVSRASRRALVIGDMPFMSYQVSTEEAVRNAGRFLKEAGAQAVKLEGGAEMADTIRAMTKAGIPVVAHIGLTPQTIHAMGTYRMHGKSDAEATYLEASAQAIEEAGAFCVVLECVEKNLAERITRALAIPTIGIGSGPACDGQVLVSHDLFGLTSGHVPKFVRPLASLGQQVKDAAAAYIKRTRDEHAAATALPEGLKRANELPLEGDDAARG